MSNTDLISRSLQSVWHPCTQMKHHEQLPLIPVRRGEGAWLEDMDGTRYLDGISSWWVNLFGHGHPAIKDAIKAQLDQLEHVMLAGFTHEPVVELSERLSALTGGRLGHAFYASDGASATEIALKMSLHYWRNLGQSEKTGFVCLQGSYHGETVGALAVTDVAIFRDAYAPLIRPAKVIPGPDNRLAVNGKTTAQVAQDAAAALEAYLSEHARSTAALIVEPLVQGASGMVMYDPLYLTLAREICSRHQVHLIADEIAVGCGRSGTFFATEQASITPDFICLSKGITGGFLPLSLVLTTHEIYAAFYHEQTVRGFLHSHSYTGNPLACAAAVATLKLFAEDHVLARNQALAQRITALAAPLRQHPRVAHFRQQGMIWAFDVIDAPADFSRRFFTHALSNNLLLRPIGNTVYWMPPYCLNEAEAAHLVSQTLHTLNTVLAE